MGGGVPKQFRQLVGRPLFLWATAFFDRQPQVRELVLVVPGESIPTVEEMCSRARLSRPWSVVAGGSRRQDSVMAGVRALSPAARIAAVHDAARPFPPTDFASVVACARRHRAAIVAWPVSETVKLVEREAITETVDRTNLWAAQTPQVFERDLLLHALIQSTDSGCEVTDEAMAIERMGIPVRIVPGSRTNLKITSAEDWIIAEALARTLGASQSQDVGTEGDPSQ